MSTHDAKACIYHVPRLEGGSLILMLFSVTMLPTRSVLDSGFQPSSANPIKFRTLAARSVPVIGPILYASIVLKIQCIIFTKIGCRGGGTLDDDIHCVDGKAVSVVHQTAQSLLRLASCKPGVSDSSLPY